MSPSTPKPPKHRNGHRTLATTTLTDMRIALYCRVSTDEQTDRKTIEAQFDFLRNWARLYDFPIVSEYADDGVSGTIPLHERPDGARLLQDAQAGCFGTVVVYRVDRLARSLRVLMDGHTALEDAGVAIKSATEPFDSSTPIGKFLFQFLGSMAELDHSTLIERINLGRDRVTRHGQWLNGPIPLGYTLDAADCLVPSTRLVESLGMTEAAMVIDLFTRIAGGSSGTAEAVRLQTLRVPLIRYYTNGTVHATEAGQWHPKRIIKLIKNETYAGVHRYKSRFGLIERPVPALVSRDLWERANAQLQCNQRLPKPNATRVYLLRGLVTCGVCGRAFVGQRMSPMHRRAPWYYRCNGQTASGSPDPIARCRNSAMNATEVEDHIWQRCCYMIEHADETLMEAQRLLDERMPQTTSTAEQEKALARDLAEKQQEEERLLTVFRRGRITLTAWEKEMDRLTQERDVLQRELQALQSQQKMTAEVVSYYQRGEQLLTHWRERLEGIEATNDREAKRVLIADLVESVVVTAEETRIRYYFRDSEDCVVIKPNKFISPPTTPSPSSVSRKKTRRRMPRSRSSGRIR